MLKWNKDIGQAVFPEKLEISNLKDKDKADKENAENYQQISIQIVWMHYKQ